MTTLATGIGETFRSLHIRNFRLFFYGQFLSQTGTWMTMVAQTLLMLDLNGSGVLLGVLAACQFGPMLLLGAWSGTLADRYNKRRLLLITQSGALLQSFVLGILVLTGRASVGLLLVMATIQGILTAFDNPSRRAFVVEMVPPSHFANAVSLNSTLMTGSRVLGPALAGILVLSVGYGWIFLIDAISYVAVLSALLAMRSDELNPSTPTPRSPGQIRQGLRYVFSNHDLFVPLVMMAIIGTLAFNFSVTTPLLVTGPLGGSRQAYTWVFSIMALASVIGALATARRQTVPTRHVIGSVVLFGIGMLGMALAPSLWLVYPAAFAVGVGSIGFMTSSTAIVQMLADPAYRGRVLSMQAMVFLGTTPIGGPFIGWVSDSSGPRVGILVGAAACFAAALWGHMIWKQRSTGQPA
jgi:MFS family permease